MTDTPATDRSHPRVQPAHLEWDAQGQPFSTQFADIYFSEACGLAETEHVFLQHNQLEARFAALAENATFVIGETGFGSGLNFLAAWRLFRRAAPASAHLHFVSAEKFPLTPSDLARALALWPELSELSAPLIARYPSISHKGFYRITLDNARVHLTLLIDDAACAFSQLLASDHPLYRRAGCTVDAWFLDGFAPAKNPEMWSDALFDCLSHLSRPGTTAATFSAAGIVKRGLKRAGFILKKVPGHGKKREMLTGCWATPSASPIPSFTIAGSSRQVAQSSPPQSPAENSESLPTTASALATEIADLARRKSAMPYGCAWHIDEASAKLRAPLDRRSVIIVGGGISGCHSARALADRGWQVQLIEQGETLATGGSGNPQGVVYAKLSPKDETQAQFNQLALQYAQQYYAPYFAELGPAFGQACGVLQLAYSAKEAQLHQDLHASYARESAQEDALVEFVDTATASQRAAVPTASGGLFFKDAGWINPRALCDALVRHPNIQVHTHTRVTALQADDDGWQLRCEGAITAAHAPALVLCTAEVTNRLLEGYAAEFPLKSIRGQITQLNASDLPALSDTPLASVVCANGYIAPPVQGIYTTGATFNLSSTDLALVAEDHATNLANLGAALPQLAPALARLDCSQLQGRAALRVSLPDYLPVVGPVADAEVLRERFAKLGKNAQAPLHCSGRYHRGLYVNVGVGSRGLAYSPLAAQLLAAQLNHEPLPITRELALCLHPARFIIRDLIKNKTPNP